MKNLKKTSTHLFKLLLPLFLLITITCGFFWRVFIKQEVPIPGDFVVGVYFPWLDYKWGYPVGVPVKNPIMADVVSFSYPMRNLAVNLLKNKQLPLWNPYILAGTPLLANFQSAPFSPTNILYFLFNNLTAWSFQIILQHLLAALFTYLLLRHWKISKTGSIIGSVIFAFSGFSLIWSQWNAHTLVASFIPLLILVVDKFLTERKCIFGVLISLILCLQIISGYPQLVLYTFLAIGLLWLFRLVEIKNKIKITLFLSIFIFLGISLSAFQILPGAELLKESQRAVEAHPFDWAFLPWEKVITFIAPDFFGNHVTGNYWGPQDYTSNTGFVGVVAIFLALFAIFNLIKKKEIKFLTIIVVFSLLLSFPTPVSILLWKSGIFGFNAAAAHRALVLFDLSTALLAGFGFDLIGKNNNKYKVLCIIVEAFVLTFFALLALSIHQEIGIKNLVLPFLVLLSIVPIVLFKPKYKILLLPLAIIELFYFGWKFTPFSASNLVFPETPIITFLKNQNKPFRTTGDHIIPINFRMSYGIEAVEGYDAVYPANSSKVVQEINGGGNFRRYAIIDNDTSPILDLVNTKYYLAMTNDPNLSRFTPDRFKKIFQDKSVIIFESITVLPRAFMVYHWQVGNSTEIFQKDFPLRNKIVLSENPSLAKESNQIAAPKNTVKYIDYQDEQSTINVYTNKDGILFISDIYYPGWHAYIDGVERNILKADFAFRAIEVPKGNHKIKMVYKPESFYIGLKISLVSMGILGIIGMSYLLWKRK